MVFFAPMLYSSLFFSSLFSQPLLSFSSYLLFSQLLLYSLQPYSSLHVLLCSLLLQFQTSLSLISSRLSSAFPFHSQFSSTLHYFLLLSLSHSSLFICFLFLDYSVKNLFSSSVLNFSVLLKRVSVQFFEKSPEGSYSVFARREIGRFWNCWIEQELSWSPFLLRFLLLVGLSNFLSSFVFVLCSAK